MFHHVKQRMLAGGLTVLISLGSAFASDDVNVLRLVPQSDLKILDPIWTTGFTTRNHGFMIYDQLFGIDAQGQIQPQMVDTYTKSSDFKVWTFTLRKGLVFSDGEPVTSNDVIASINRWAKRDVFGQVMAQELQVFEAVDDSHFKMVFKTPFPMVLDAFSKQSGSPSFIMPKRVAMTPADQQIKEYIGSGPYVIKMDEYKPGSKIVYLKNEKYIPRTEAPSGTAGGKHVYVDRLEWIVLKDAQTQANAIANGEVDMIELMPPEQYATLKANPKLEIVKPMPSGSSFMHLNHLIPPFNNPQIARAAIMAINQEALMRAQFVNKDLYRTCTSIYPCSSAFVSPQTDYFTGKPQFEAARKALQDAGYDGKPVLLLYPTDLATINKFPPVLAQLLKQAGFNVDMQAMDWASVQTRRAKKDLPENGGWNVFVTGFGYPDMMNPLFFPPLTGNGEKGWFGWTTDPKLQQLKADFMLAPDLETRKKIAIALQLQNYDTVILAKIGDYDYNSVVRKGVVTGLLYAPVNVFWNLKKN